MNKSATCFSFTDHRLFPLYSHASPGTGSLDTPSTPPTASVLPSPPPSLPSSNPPIRPCRPKPPPPLVKSSQSPLCAPAPVSTPPPLPPLPPSISKPPPPLSPTLKPSPPLSIPPPTPVSHNPLPLSLPPPLAPTPVSPAPLTPLQQSVSSDLTPSLSPLPTALLPAISCPAPSSASLPPPPPPPPNSVIPPSPPAPLLVNPIDRLVASVSVWQPKGLSRDQATSVLEKEMAGAFLLLGAALSVRLPDEGGAAPVHHLTVKQHKTFLHLDGSSLAFDDIFKLILFYTASSHPAESRSPKAAVRRTPTTVMLGRARYRLSTVLTGLISHDRRLTQRLVELARDPHSYFGNLVKEHRMFTLETMSKHSSSTELLQEIRQMMTQLKSYLLQSTELQAMLEPQHQYTQDKLESLAEAALCKSVLKPLREPIYEHLEKLHTSDGSLKQLAQNQSGILGSTTTALGITTAVPEASSMEKINIKLNNLHLEYSPQKKIELMLKACKLIYDSMSVSSPGRAHGADDLLPVMMYVLARSNLSSLQLDVEYMMELMDPSLALGEGSYYLTTTYGALEHIKTFDQQRSATRQLSREVQDSIHRWERRLTLNKERMVQGSVRDFLTVCCPEIGASPKTLGVLPTTTMQELAEQCATRFEQGKCLEEYVSVYEYMFRIVLLGN
uniref:Ras and Rab interactor 3 n=1 Tax=Gasterosteus aculeatus aculeatus TaxID=481459 RepID=G3PIP8_GASAC